MVMSAFLQAEMILESYAEVDSKQFKTGNTLHQLVQCSMVPNNKWLQIINNQKLISTVSCEFKISTRLFLGLQPHDKAAMLGVSTTDYMEIEVSSQGGEMHLFLTTNMPRDFTCKPAPSVQVEWSELFVRFFLVRVLFIVFSSFVLRHLAIALVHNAEKLRGNRRPRENYPDRCRHGPRIDGGHIKTGPFKNSFDRLYCALWLHKKSI